MRRFYRHVARDDLAAYTPDQLVEHVAAMREFATLRAPGTPLIDVVDGPAFTLLRVVTDDMPFLVDSVGIELAREGRSIHLIIHPQVVVRRDGEGRLVEVLDIDPDDDRPSDATNESWMHIELDHDLVEVSGEETVRGIARVLADVRAAVQDWQAMRAKAVEIADSLATEPIPAEAEGERAEAAALLRWLADEHFTFLGYREYDLVTTDGEDALRSVPGSELGILRSSAHGSSQSFSKLPPPVRAKARERTILILSKANSRATVHRGGYLDYIGIKKFDANGEPIAERRFLGLFTASAYNALVADVPVLRQRFRDVLDAIDVLPGSHSARDLQHIIEAYPRDELFQTDSATLTHIAASIMQLQERRQVRLFVRPDAYGRFMSCLVYLPRDRFNTKTRHRIEQALLEAFGGQSTDYTVRLTESVLARLHIIVHLPVGSTVPDFDPAVVEARVAEASRSWDDELAAAFVDAVGEGDARRLMRVYGDAFPEAYKEDFPAADGVRAALVLEGLGEGDIALDFYAPKDPAAAGAGEVRFAIVHAGEAISLSTVLPMLQTMGMEVTDERPYGIERPRRAPAWVLDFGLRPPAGEIVDEATLPLRFSETFRAAWDGRIEADGFNALVVRAGLTFEQASIVRAYARYLRQAGTTFGQDYLQQVVTSRADIVTLIVRLFEAQFDPAFAGGDREGTVAGLVTDIEAALETVPSLDHDRILRSLFALVRATLRTNFYVPVTARRSSALAFKLDALAIPDLPLPRPKREVWVHSPRVEGVHLRFGMVARGGLRWSDRREDFRTEILGLVKAQEVKNSVIVPVGAKGGFVPARLPDPAVDRDAWLTEGKGAYRDFISALLDVTDNLVDGVVVPPVDVIRRDGDDPYLVVAADKGTATFSDLANSISAEYGFWLGDAFASGGSVGYDHKAMGITARGAWESVKRHFRELGVDTQTEPFTAVGVGDMSGDVFGNGMLLSEHTRLVAAFDHRDIFIDPTPDAARSFAERQRLFDLPRSSWADYDSALISAGGGVFSRAAKSIPLSAEAKAALGIDESVTALAPADLMRAILTAPVDLLWNGGIGTYVKSRTESSVDVGDKANDLVRVNGSELRCRVVGEGGNLGCTQRGRVEAALNGVHINTDAIDNSAGVDTSDHEVNIKILLDGLVRDGRLDADARVALLGEMTDEVAKAVLKDNYAQNIVLGNARTQAPSMLGVHQRLIRDLERTAGLDRRLEALPDDAEIANRRGADIGLTSPELAVLLAYVKIGLTASLTACDVADDPWFDRFLRDYFPSQLTGRFGSDLESHPLRREIINTVLANRVVNIGGITFVFRAIEETGASPDDVVRATIAAMEIFGIDPLLDEIDALDNRIPTQAQVAIELVVRRLLDRATRWMLQTRGTSIDVASEIAHFKPVVDAAANAVPGALQGVEAQRLERQVATLIELGAPTPMAARVGALLDVFALLDIADIARRTDADPLALVSLYFTVSERYDVDRMLVRITGLPRGDRWSTLARHSLRADLYQLVAALTEQIWMSTPAHAEPIERIAMWEQVHEAGLARSRATLDEIADADEVDLATLSVALRVMRNLAAQARTSAEKEFTDS